MYKRQRLYLSKKYYRIPNEDGEVVEAPYREPDYDGAFAMDMSGVPGALESFMPLLVPIVLILINTVATAVGATTGIMEILIFLGQPIVAVGIGLLVAIFTLGRKLDRHTCLSEMEKGMMSAGIIMLVTGCLLYTSNVCTGIVNHRNPFFDRVVNSIEFIHISAGHETEASDQRGI